MSDEYVRAGGFMHSNQIKKRDLEEALRGWEDCGHACNHVWPYGFVREEGCPIHDIPDNSLTAFLPNDAETL